MEKMTKSYELKRLLRLHFTRTIALRIIDEVFPEHHDYKVDNAIEFLEIILGKGPVSTTTILREAKKHGIKQTTLYRAAAELRLTRKGSGFGKSKKSTWSLRR